MALDMGAGAGGADMLQQVLARHLQEQQMRAQIANMAEQRALQARGQDYAMKRFDIQRQDDMAAEDAKQKAVQQAAAAGKAQATLRAGIQGSFNAGAGDPNGAKATRDALRIAMTAGGADARDIPQEPVAAAPKLYAVTVAGPKGEPIHKLVTQDQLQAGVREYRAPQKADKPAAPQMFFDADGKPRALQYGPNGFTEVPLPAGIAGKTAPKPAAKTPEQIEAEHEAMARGAVKGKQAGGGQTMLGMAANYLFGGDEKPETTTAASGGPKMGDVKTFPNGKKAVWDGTGWAAQ